MLLDTSWILCLHHKSELFHRMFSHPIAGQAVIRHPVLRLRFATLRTNGGLGDWISAPYQSLPRT